MQVKLVLKFSKSYYNSFIKKLGVGLATARAGNIIGGGDWSKNRLIPDIINSINKKKKISHKISKCHKTLAIYS